MEIDIKSYRASMVEKHYVKKIVKKGKYNYFSYNNMQIQRRDKYKRENEWTYK